MSHTFTRQSLYDLAWSEPIQSLAKKLSLSDRGLARICTAANIPVPARGYWAKKQAGKPVSPVALPPRALGQTDFVHIGRDWYRNDSEDAEILSTPIPSAPVFTPDMEAVRAQAAKLVAKAPLPLRDAHGWHSQIQKLLNADEERARKQRADPYPSSWNAPLFEGPFELRRPRILNALFVCLTRCGASPHVGDRYGRDLSVTVGTTNVPLVLDSMTAAKQIERERQVRSEEHVVVVLVVGNRVVRSVPVDVEAAKAGGRLVGVLAARHDERREATRHPSQERRDSIGLQAADIPVLVLNRRKLAREALVAANA